MASQEKEPLISVIVPIFQVEKYLDNCISSIITQTYQNLEIILVDDGSTDKCPEICEEYKGLDNRIKVIHKKNGGLSQARNVGLEIATGDFIGFVDSDDWIEPNMYEILISTILDMEADIAVCGYQDEYDGIKSIKNNINSFKRNQYTPEKALRYILKGKSFISIMVWNKLYKRTIVENIRFPEGKIYEDNLWTPLVIGNAKTIASTDYPLYHYLNRPESLSHDIQQIHKRFHDKIEMCETRLFFIHKNFPTLEKTAISYIQDFCCREFINISINFSHLDIDNKLRCELYEHFCRFGLKSLCKFDSLKMTFAKILFWLSPILITKIYLYYNKIHKEKFIIPHKQLIFLAYYFLIKS